MLRRNKRIKGREVIKVIIKNGELKKMRFFVCRFSPNELGFNRYAIAISKKLDKRAVGRNRKRRQVFSAIQKLQTRESVLNPSSSDIVLLARNPIMNASFEDIYQELHKLLTNGSKST